MNNEGVYVKIDRSLYGTIEAAKVWYDTLSANLLSGGFKANTFDTRVFNMDFKKADQLTVPLYVDDSMISCVNRQGNDYIIDFLNIDYSKATVYEGSTIDYLGMLFDFVSPGEVSISMGNSCRNLLLPTMLTLSLRQRVTCISFMIVK